MGHTLSGQDVQGKEREMKKASIAVLAVLVVALLVAGCGPKQQPEQSAPSAQDERSRTIILADPQSLRNADPAVAYDGPSAQYVRACYETLIRYKGTAADEFEPVLAESWSSSADGMVWTFKLRRGVKFHDGTEMDGEAVKFSFERLMKVNKGLAWMFAASLDENSIKVPDKYTVEFHLKAPYGPFLETIASEFGSWILSPAAVKAHEKDGDLAQDWLRFHDAGTGPYMIAEVKPEQEVTLVRFPDYWRGWSEGQAEKVIIRTVREAATRRMLLERGDVDMVNRPGPDDVDAFRANPEIKVYEEPALRKLWIFMNTQRGPLKKPEVRHAISYAFDYDGYIQGALKGHATQAHGPLPKNMWGHDPSLLRHKRDLEKAKGLLKKAGYPEGGFTLRLMYLGYDDMRAAAQVMEASLAELGIKVEIQEVTGGALNEMINSADPAKMADMYTLQIYKRVQQILVEEAPCVWLVDLPETVGTRANVEGYYYNPYYPNTFDALKKK